MNIENGLLFLSYLNLDYQTKNSILEFFSIENLDEIFNISKEDLLESKILTKKNLEKIIDKREKFDADIYRDFLEKKDINFVSFFDDDYPINLKNVEFAPQILYYKGTLLKDDEFALSVVGSRKCTNYGSWATEKLTTPLAELGIRIVSGMALGIDSIAHKSALKSNGRTLAVLGCGVDQIYPKTNFRLYEEIIDNGAVISEFPPTVPPLAYNFPVRNRIISGLSKALLVIEAQEKSGTLITARFANEQSKEIFALPGNINSLYSKGTNSLIKDGALIATSYEDILDGVMEFSEFVNNSKREEKDLSILSEKELLIYKIILESPKSANKISELTGISIIEINTILTSLEIKNYITELNGGIFTI